MDGELQSVLMDDLTVTISLISNKLVAIKVRLKIIYFLFFIKIFVLT